MKKILLTMMAAGLITTGFGADSGSVGFSTAGLEEAHLAHVPSAQVIDISAGQAGVSPIILGGCIYYDSSSTDADFNLAVAFTDEASEIASLYTTPTENLDCAAVNAHQMTAHNDSASEINSLYDGTGSSDAILAVATDTDGSLFAALTDDSTETLNLTITKDTVTFGN